MKTLFDIVFKNSYKSPEKPGQPGKGGFMVTNERRGRRCTVHPGDRYGRLVVLRRVENGARRQARFLCRCDCGTEVIVLAYVLRAGTTKSCGCLRRELMRRRAEALAEAQKDD